MGKNRRIKRAQQNAMSKLKNLLIKTDMAQYNIGTKSATNSFPIIPIKSLVRAAAIRRAEKLIAVSYCSRPSVGMDQS